MDHLGEPFLLLLVNKGKLSREKYLLIVSISFHLYLRHLRWAAIYKT